MSAETVSDWIALLDHLYPPAHAQDWDSPGLQVGDPAQSVTGVLVTLDITEDVILEAAREGCDLIVAHHPVLFRPLTRLSPGTAPGRLALLAAQLGISVFAAHTNFDARPDTTSWSALKIIGVTNPEPLERDANERALGLIGDLPAPQSIASLHAAIRDGLPSPLARLATHDPDATVTRVACVGGSGASMIPQAITAGAEVMITGDVSHHDALDALTQGLSVIDAGHYATESPAMALVIHHLTNHGPTYGCTAPVKASTVSTDPWAHTPYPRKG